MRDRHTPRVLLLPRDGSFACPEQACEESNARWKTIATAMRHVKRCTHVLQRGTLYCSTLTGTKSAKITPEEQRERNRAAAKKSNARVQAKARAKAQAKARAQAAARRAGKETADDDAMSNLPSAGSKADADADDVRVRGSDIQCTQTQAEFVQEDHHEQEAEQQMVCYQAEGPDPNTAASITIRTGNALEYMQSGKRDLSDLPEQYWKSILVQGYKCGVIATEAEFKDAALSIGPKALFKREGEKIQRNMSMISKIKRRTNALLHPDHNGQQGNEVCKELNALIDKLHKGNPAERKQVLEFERKAARCLVYKYMNYKT